MTRVSENSNTAALKYSINKVKSKLEDLQIKGTTLKRISRPSDDPISNVQGLSLKSIKSDNDQYIKNIDTATNQLNITDKALEQITDILVKAKEIALAQSSSLYDDDTRKNISHEVIQLRGRLLALSNTSIGNRHIFAGHKTLTTPFDKDGNYYGDTGRAHLEVSKDFFIPINLNGEEIFFSNNDTKYIENPLDQINNDTPPSEVPKEIPKEQDGGPDRNLASVEEVAKNNFGKRENLFGQLSILISGLENNDIPVIQDLLEGFDNSISRLITMRTRIGSLSNTIEHVHSQIETDNLNNAELHSKLVDVDVAELFSDMAKQQQILKTAYQSGQAVMNKSLLDFIK